MVCGVLIVLAVGLSAAYLLMGESWALLGRPGVWVYETVALSAFGVSWLVKRWKPKELLPQE